MVMRLIAGAALICLAVGWACPNVRAETPTGHDSSAASAAEAEGHSSGEKSAAEGMNPITFHGMNFPGDLSVWTAVVFVIVLLVLWRFAWGPLAKGLEKREQEIANQIAEAHHGNEEARRLLQEYEKKLAASQDEVQGILDDARRRADQAGRELLDKARNEATGEHQRAVQQIEAAAAAAAKELAERSATLAVDLAGKIVRAKLDPKDHARLIQDAVAGFAASGSGKK